MWVTSLQPLPLLPFSVLALIGVGALLFPLSSTVFGRLLTCTVSPADLRKWGKVNASCPFLFNSCCSIVTESKAKAVETTATIGAAPASIGFVEAFMLPNVASYALAFGFFKLVSLLDCHC